MRDLYEYERSLPREPREGEAVLPAYRRRQKVNLDELDEEGRRLVLLRACLDAGKDLP